MDVWSEGEGEGEGEGGEIDAKIRAWNVLHVWLNSKIDSVGARTEETDRVQQYRSKAQQKLPCKCSHSTVYQPV